MKLIFKVLSADFCLPWANLFSDPDENMLVNSENLIFFTKLKFGLKKIKKFSTGEIPKTFFSDSL